MSIDPKAQSGDKAKCCGSTAWKAIAALVLLRICIGWHFFNEGAKKFSYDVGRQEWSIVVPVEGFFRMAKGPLSGFLHNQLPGDHHWQSLLATPREMTPASDEQLKSWVTSYVSRRQKEIKIAKPTDVEIPEFVPFAAWEKRITDDWRASHQRFVGLSALDDSQRKQAAGLYARRRHQLADYLVGESLEIQTYQHELWRLAESQKVAGADQVPFKQKRIAAKKAELARTPLKWAASVKAQEAQFLDDLHHVLTAEQLESGAADAAASVLTDPKTTRLGWMKVSVSWLVLGVGVCLMLGLFTRLASIGGALFLLSVIAMQPPWVPGANVMFFYYQMVEIAAFILLAATGAGRWAGLDFFLEKLCSGCCGAKAKKK